MKPAAQMLNRVFSLLHVYVILLLLPPVVSIAQPRGIHYDSTLLANTIGFVTVNENDTVSPHRLYNADGSFWRGLSSLSYPEIEPHAYHPDYALFIVRCTGKQKGWYEVVINEHTGLKKRIKSSDKSFVFQTVEQHILSVPFVQFAPTTNPPRQSPSSSAPAIEADPEEAFSPVEVKGEWLKLRWGGAGQEHTGWIQWRKGNVLLIELFYLC